MIRVSIKALYIHMEYRQLNICMTNPLKCSCCHCDKQGMNITRDYNGRVSINSKKALTR